MSFLSPDVRTRKSQDSPRKIQTNICSTKTASNDAEIQRKSGGIPATRARRQTFHTFPGFPLRVISYAWDHSKRAGSVLCLFWQLASTFLKSSIRFSTLTITIKLSCDFVKFSSSDSPIKNFSHDDRSCKDWKPAHQSETLNGSGWVFKGWHL